MTAPALLPTPKPMAEAIAYQVQRIPRPRPEFDLLDDQARRLSWTIAGFVRRAVLEESFGHATKHIAEGTLREDFLEHIGRLADQEGIFLSPERLDLIAQNHFANVTSAGRWEQLNDPDILAERPYRQYPLGPHDPQTSEICLKLEGLVWLAGDPVEKHIIPANHHKERHVKVLSLTKEQAEASGKLYASAGEMEYPVIDGQTILPDPGFDSAPGLMRSDSADLARRAAAAGEAVTGKAPASYGLGELSNYADRLAHEMPRKADAADWKEFRRRVGFGAGEEDETILVDTHGDGVRINEATFNAIGGRGAGLIRMAVADPLEVWFVQRENGFSRRYLSLVDMDDEVRGMWLEVSRDGWLYAGELVELEQLEQLRGGLLLMSKARLN